MAKPTADQSMLEAAASGELGALTRELENGASLFAKDLAGYNALCLSIVHGHEDLALVLVGRMLQDDPSMAWLTHTVKANGHTVFLLAVNSRKLRTLAALLALPASPESLKAILAMTGSQLGETAAHLAARENSVRSLQMLLKACPAAMELLDASGANTPLGTAVGADQAEAVACLLKEGANPGWETPECPPAWSRVRSSAMATLLGEQLVWSDVRDAKGRSILHVVASRGRELKVPFFRSLLNRPGCEALLNAQDGEGKTPLHHAMGSSMGREVVDLMVERGASWWIEDGEKNTPADILEQKVAGGWWSLDNDVLGFWRAQAKQQRMEGLYAASPVEGKSSHRL